MGALHLPARAGQRSPAAILGLAVLVLAAHLLLAEGLVQQTQAGWGKADKPPPAIEVAFVRELQAAAPPARVMAAVPPVARLPALAARPKPAASQAARPEPKAVDAAPAQPAAPTEAAPLLPEPALAADSPPRPTPLLMQLPLPAQAAVEPAPAAAPASASVPTAAPAVAGPASFDWPPSTRLRFKLEGHYRGPINGSAQVDWLRAGQRYQVHLETSLGPVLSRHITSEGELTAAGLAPQRFDGEQHVLFRPTKRWGQRFTPERITLADGSEVAAQPGAQDEASQFVQLTWLFTTRPDLLQVGRSVDVPLALNRRLDVWTYDVVGQETLYLPFGQVDTFHVKPRREAGAGVMTAEIWFAPTLQTLPVRILIRQDSESWINLTLEKPPLQAAR